MNELSNNNNNNNIASNNNNNNNNNKNGYNNDNSTTPEKPNRSPSGSSSRVNSASRSLILENNEQQQVRSGTSRITKIALVLLGGAIFGGATYYFAPETVEMGLKFAARTFSVIGDYVAFGATVAVEFAIANPIVAGIAALVATIATVAILRYRKAPTTNSRDEDIPTIENFLSPVKKKELHNILHSAPVQAPQVLSFEAWYAQNKEQIPELLRVAVAANKEDGDSFDLLDDMNYLWENICNDQDKKAEVFATFDSQLKIDFFHYAVYLYDANTLYKDLLKQEAHIIPSIAKACPDDLNNFIIAYDTLAQTNKNGRASDRINTIFTNALYEAVNAKPKNVALVLDIYKDLEKQALDAEATEVALISEFTSLSSQLRYALLDIKMVYRLNTKDAIITLMKKSPKYPTNEVMEGFVLEFAENLHQEKKAGNDRGILRQSALEIISENTTVLEVLIDALSQPGVSQNVGSEYREKLISFSNTFDVHDKKKSLNVQVTTAGKQKKVIQSTLHNVETLVAMAKRNNALVDDNSEEENSTTKGERFKHCFTQWLEENSKDLHRIAKTNFFTKTAMQLSHKDLTRFVK